MLYRLAFKVIEGGYLQITAFAKGVPNVSAVHINAEVFAVAVRIAGVPEPTSSELTTAAKEAYVQNGIDVCCELVELSWPQVEVLCLQPKEGKTA